MIKYQLFLVLFISCYVSSAQSIMVGLGGTYGTSVDQLGVNARVYYGLNEQLCFGPEISYFPQVSHKGESIRLNEYGFVVHYIFEVEEKLGLYPLIGINYSVENTEEHGVYEVQNAIGATFGGGLHLEMKNILPFVEYKYITGGLSQSTFSVGIIYNFSLKQKQQEE